MLQGVQTRSLLAVEEPLPLFFFQAEDGIRDTSVTGVQTCALPIFPIWNELLAVVRLDGRRSVRWRLTSRRSPGNTGASGSEPSCLPNLPSPVPSPLDARLAGLSHLSRAAFVIALELRTGMGAGCRLHCSGRSLFCGDFALHQQSIFPAANG